MEDALSTGSAPNTSIPSYRCAVAVNSEYAVIHLDSEIYTLRLDNLEDEPKYLPCPRASGWRYPVLSVSSDTVDLLCISHGFEAYIFDLRSHRLQYTVPGNGRTITSLSLCNRRVGSVATGHIDGSICLWDLDDLKRPAERLYVTAQACNALELSSADGDYLASLHGGKLYVQYFAGNAWQSIRALSGQAAGAFAWNPRKPGRLAVSNTDGELCIYDLAGTTKNRALRRSSESSDDESDGGVFGQPDDILEELWPISKLHLDAVLRSLSWASDVALIGHTEGGEDAFLYGIDEDSHELTQLCCCRFEDRVEALQLLNEHGSTIIIGVTPRSTTFQHVPDDAVERLHLNGGRIIQPAASSNDTEEESGNQTTVLAPTRSAPSPTEIKSSPGMNPLAIRSQRAETSAFTKTSRQLQHLRRMSRFRKTANSRAATEGSIVDRQATSISPGARSSRSGGDLSGDDLPIFETEDDFGSPMPFLSPGIPSARALPSDIPLLNDSAITPPKLQDRSKGLIGALETSVPATGPDTDDSDDETFVDDIHGRATFLPGGVNVPLPKACGALFASNGQLLTFFPPKPRPATVRDESVEELPPDQRSKSDKMTRLFPTFGNLELSSDSASGDSDSGRVVSHAWNNGHFESMPRFTFQPASFPSQHSRKAQDAAAHPAVYTEQPQHRIIVNVYEIADIGSLQPQQRSVAGEYRLLCNASESGAELGEYNASVAETAGSADIANIWRLLAMLLSDQAPLEILSGQSAQNDILAIARQATSITRKDSGILLSAADRKDSTLRKLHWTDHPFGGSWLVRRILGWAEERADTQSLACFCAVLSESERGATHGATGAEQSMLTRLPTFSIADGTETTNSTTNPESRQVIPVLRTHSATITSLHESPTKVTHRGAQSSSLASQTSLSHSDSSTTPPFPSPLLSRQSTHPSASGSSSPEFQRGSFSTAARYYAQSFSERFVYGSSPPAKKADTSPTTSVELSTSLPGGSWPGKSVSFASTTTDSTPHRSLSVSASKTGLVEDVGYDSDKTIEDSGLPSRTKSEKSNAALSFSNQEVLADDVRGIARAKLMPDELANRIAIWNSYYAEQLRSWEMLAQASELEKVFGLTTGVVLGMESTNARDDAVLPKPVSKQRKSTCEICLVSTKGVMQVCPACLHSSHLQCLEEFCNDLPEREFTCPSGCGCSCAGLPFLVQEVVQQSPQRPIFKKKASFTDPRRWRSRVEGDSW